MHTLSEHAPLRPSAHLLPPRPGAISPGEPARAVASRLATLLAAEHASLADFLLALAEFDRRRLWVLLGHPSLFSFLRRHLGLSSGSAFLRSTAAGLLRRVPAVEAPLRDGRLCLSSVAELARVLTEENAADLLPRFFHLSRREAREVAAALRPSDVVARRDLVTRAPGADPAASSRSAWPRPAPSRSTDPSAPDSSGAPPLPFIPAGVDPAAPAISWEGVGAPVLPVPPIARAPAPATSPDLGRTDRTSPDRAQDDVVAPDLASPDLAGPPPPAARPVWPPLEEGPRAAPPPPPESIDPLTADLRRLHVTVSRRFLDKLAAARAALSRSLPGAGTEQILEAALDLLLADRDRRRGLVERPLPRRGKRAAAARARAGRDPSAEAPTGAEVRPASADPASTNEPPPTPAPACSPTTTLMHMTMPTPTPTPTPTLPPTATLMHMTMPTPTPTLPPPPDRSSAPTPAPTLPPPPDCSPTTTPPLTLPPARATGSEALLATSPRHRRAIPAAVRREVWRRDGGRCRWPIDGGAICGSITRLELDHIVPLARGGAATAAGLRLLCHFHNQLAARLAFGHLHVERAMAARGAPGTRAG